MTEVQLGAPAADAGRAEAAGSSARARALAGRAAPIALIVAAQAWFFSHLRVQVTGDGTALYLPAARNLLRHGRYSVMDGPPFLPTITKMPGYSVLLAVIEAVFGAGLAPIRAVQFAMLGLTALLCGELGRRHFDARTGTVAAVLVAACPSLGYYAQLPLSEALTCLLTVAHVGLLLELTTRSAAAPRRQDLMVAAGAGGTLGLLVLVRQSFAFLLPLVALAAVIEGRRRADLRGGLRRAIVASVTCLALVAPWCVRNMVVSGESLPFGANSGLSLLASVRQYEGGFDDRYLPPYIGTITEELTVIDAERGMPSGTAPGMGEGIGGGAAREAALDDRLGTIARQELADLSPGEVLLGIPGRLTKLWGGNPLFPALAPFEVLTMLIGMVGVVVLRRRGTWPLWILLPCLSAFHIVFHVEQRYSVPARAPLLIITAAVLVKGHRRLAHRREAQR